MPSWTHLIRFVAEEDSQPHIGQLVDTSRDVGLDTFEGKAVRAYKIIGTIFDGEVTKTVLTVKYVSIGIKPSSLPRKADSAPPYSYCHRWRGRLAIISDAWV